MEMLNFLDEGKSNRPPQPQPYSTDKPDEKLTSRQESVLDRLAVRRWLIALAALLFASLAVLHALPLSSVLIACAAFAAGAALIPRVGTIYLPPPLILTSKGGPRPETVIRTLINGLPEPVIVLSREGTIVQFNTKAASAFDGLKPGWHISGAIRNPKLLDGVASAAATERGVTVAYTDRVPVERHMEVTIAWLETASEARDPAMMLFLRDLTEQKRLDEMRADFIANASHELKTPLASVLGFIETLQGAAKNDAAARERFLGIMATQAERMARLIDNLMSLSRVEMRAHLKPQDHVNIADVVRSAADALDPVAREAGVRLVIETPEKDAIVLGDRDELTQVFINLIHNGVKYGRRDGRVNISIARKSEAGGAPRIWVAVQDDGPGISAQHLPRLTERFYRVPDIAPDRAGTGLGLAIAKHVINRHRGELRIESEEGAGSQFTVILNEPA